MAHKSYEHKHMSGAAAVRNEVCQQVRDVVALVDGNRKAAIAFASKALNLPFDRVRRMYYGQARMIHAHEADQIRAYVQAAQELIEARASYEALRSNYLANAHPSLLRLAPPELAADEISAAAQEAVAADKTREPVR